MTTTALAAAGEPVTVLGRFPLDPADPSDDHGVLFAHPRTDEGEEDVLVCHFGHLLEVDDSLESLPALRPGDVLVRAHEEARWVRWHFRTAADLEAWTADPVGWGLDG
ncbi:hypothetical protein [Kineococcus rhizosphaerae]|uniref:Uncharacterized protein n=1 Tax=Kineococcus rhizosphaerae TaxID=559628 RepID=A0A2T0R1X9_9ACTN|nr:hypothetical protein [Kineococcus rhizosphaerae]PRY13568.1 hypothetical protein CLV37_108238 [Kineococcus rhizosphaerae]